MPKAMETRNYPMADADLKQSADSLKANINRDLADFAVRNITATQVTAFQQTIDVFDNTTTDQELLGLVKDATETKNTIAENIRKAIRPIRNMADLAYNGKSKYSSFGFEDMNNLSDNDLYRLARRVVRVGTALLSDLSAQGLTQAQLTALNNLATALDTAIDEVGKASENRDLETQDRIIKGNTLWAEMTRLASIGRSLYEDTNEAKYNDYVLVGSSPSKPSDTPPPTPTPGG